MKKQLLLLVMMLLPMMAMADAVEIGGIYYNLFTKYKSAEVTKNPNNYSGAVDIPESFTYDGVVYSVTEIGSSAFAECTSLTSVTIPNTVTAIEHSAFEGCTGLTSVVVPNSVTSIDIFVFNGCTALTTVTIGNGIKKIGVEAFANCIVLRDFYCSAENVPSIKVITDLPYTDAFEGTPIGKATLHVPDGSINSYSQAEPWKYFGTIQGFNGASVTNAIWAEDGNAKIYDLNGRQVEHPLKGLYIKNGKKYVVK